VTRDELRATALRVLGEIAPEADLAALHGDVGFRDQLDLDSMDVLNFVIAVDEELGVGIPESDYPRLLTLDAFVAYLAERLDGREAAPPVSD
jgi:acyl carrier protein